jgi:thiamine transporter ThiT
MNKFKENLAKLINVKTIVTFMVVSVFATLALKGDISPENVQNITLMVIAFYFGTQYEKKNT